MSRSRCHVPPKPLPLSFSRGSLPSDGSSVLVILFETNPLLWSGLGGRLDGKESFDETLRQLLVYMIGFLSLHEQNRVVIIALHSNVEHCMYAIPTLASGENDLTNTGSKSDLCAQVISNLATLANQSKTIGLDNILEQVQSANRAKNIDEYFDHLAEEDEEGFGIEF